MATKDKIEKIWEKAKKIPGKDPVRNIVKIHIKTLCIKIPMGKILRWVGI